MKREKLNILSERDILVGLITSDKFCREIAPVINPRHLELPYARTVASWIKEYFSSFKKAPKHDMMKLYRTHCEELTDEALQNNILTFIEKLNDDYTSLGNEDFAVEESVKYLKLRALKNLSEDINAFVTVGDEGKAEDVVTKFKRFERESGESANILNSTSEITQAFINDGLEEELLPISGALGKVIGKLHREDFISVLAPMKRGKCLKKGTEILMHDGSVKTVENLQKGDKLMGVDSTPRTVESTSKGYGKMYRITSKVNPLRKDKTPEIDFTCNGDHILVLKNVWKEELSEIKKFNKNGTPNGEYTKHSKNNLLKKEEVEISVDDFMKLSDYQKSHLKLFKCGVDYKGREHIIPPYLLGLWLGDGTSTCSEISTIDSEIMDICQKYGEELNDEVTMVDDKSAKRVVFSKKNKVKNNESGVFSSQLRTLKLWGNKHIPKEYLIDSRDNRLQLLAGIVDTDGYNSKDGGCIEITLMNKTLAEDIKKLSQQLGFRTVMLEKYKHYKGMYPETDGWAYSWVVKIKGRLSEIPVILERKKAKDNVKYNNLNNTFSFNIEYVGEDDYYGFVLDGDHKFLLADTTVSHNTHAMIYMAEQAMKAGLKVMFFSLEMSREAVIKRLWTSLTGQSTEPKENVKIPYFEKSDYGDNYDIKYKIINRKAVDVTEIEKKQKAMKRMFRGGTIEIVSVPALSLTVEKLEVTLDDFEQKGYIPDVIIIDYADIMLPSEKGEYRHQLDSIWKRLRGLAQKRKALVITASQSGRKALNKDVDATDIAEDVRKIAHVTSMFSLNQTEQDIKNGILRVKQVALREGEREFRQAVCTQCLTVGSFIMDSKFDDEVNYDCNEMNDYLED